MATSRRSKQELERDDIDALEPMLDDLELERIFGPCEVRTEEDLVAWLEAARYPNEK